MNSFEWHKTTRTKIFPRVFSRTVVVLMENDAATQTTAQMIEMRIVAYTNLLIIMQELSLHPHFIHLRPPLPEFCLSV